MVELSIEARGLGKAYRRYASPRARALELATLGRLRRHSLHWALRDVELQVERGGMLGLVGANGSGKSTLLKVLAGTSWPTAGGFRVRGRVSSLLELGAGFHPELSGRENIALAARLAGLGGRAAQRIEGPALEFSGLEDFADEPVRTYSSGMAMRLGFAVATATEPDVLLLDEVLAVGDLVFQERCVERVLDFRRRGVTIVFASHSLYDVRNLCDSALWLQAGCPAKSGDPDLVTNAYAARQRAVLAAEPERGTSSQRERGELPHLTEIELTGVDLTGSGAVPVRHVSTGDDLEVRVGWRNPAAPAKGVQVGVALLGEDRQIVAAAATHHAPRGSVEGLGAAAGTTVLRLPRLALLSGRVRVMAVLFDADGVHRWDERFASGALEILAGTPEVGLVRLAHEWRAEPGCVSEPGRASESASAAEREVPA